MNNKSVLAGIIFSVIWSMSFNLQADTNDHHHNEKDASVVKSGVVEMHHTTGTVTQVEASRGLIIIHHPPIASLEWDEMTMPFPIVDKAMLKGIKIGDKVKLDLTMPNDVATISKIEVVNN
ncbi:copper-binding protein [Budvicia diplopodorum]|uniref:copper-binding protein n=1 Tax=Budvicia diplopodorum TaxID=1119056 RepID=UPI0013590B22|nr:copper-binding protein [Budvicia diplopodorum]